MFTLFGPEPSPTKHLFGGKRVDVGGSGRSTNLKEVLVGEGGGLHAAGREIRHSRTFDPYDPDARAERKAEEAAEAERNRKVQPVRTSRPDAAAWSRLLGKFLAPDGARLHCGGGGAGRSRWPHGLAAEAAEAQRKQRRVATTGPDGRGATPVARRVGAFCGVGRRAAAAGPPTAPAAGPDQHGGLSLAGSQPVDRCVRTSRST